MLTPTQVIQKLSSLKGDRSNFENVWQEIGELILPRKDDITVQRSPGEKKYGDLLDSTAMTSNELLAGALHSMLTNPAGYFFNLSTGKPAIDQIDEVRQWIQEVVRLIHEKLNNTNFQTEIHEVYLDLGAFGTACLLSEEDEEKLIRFSAKPLKEIYIDENSKGYIDCLYRCIKWTAKDMVDEFGYDGLPDKIKKAYDANKTEKFEVIHAIYPKPKNKKGETGKYKVFDYISQYVLVSEKVNLEVEGFREFPYQVPRWTKASGEKYGRGCGEKALPGAKSLQKMRETVLRGAQKTIDPPLQAPDDGFFNKVNVKPAGINYYRSGTQDRIVPILNDARIDYGFQTIQDERTQVREAYYTDQLKLREGPQMTATEVAERVEQALRFLGPMLGRLQSELLQPLIERIYNILDRRGEIPEAPAQIRGMPLNIQYSSVIAMQQRMSEVQNIARTMQNIAPFASADPAVLDNIDGDQALKFVAKLFNFPQEIIRKADDVKNMREARAKAQQQQQQAVQQADQADSASKVISASSKLKPAG